VFVHLLLIIIIIIKKIPIKRKERVKNKKENGQLLMLEKKVKSLQDGDLNQLHLN